MTMMRTRLTLPSVLVAGMLLVMAAWAPAQAHEAMASPSPTQAQRGAATTSPSMAQALVPRCRQHAHRMLLVLAAPLELRHTSMMCHLSWTALVRHV